MKATVDQLKKLAQEDPKVFIDVIDNMVAIIDLLLGLKEVPEVEAKFKHSKELYRAECLLDADLDRKGKLAEKMIALIFEVAQFAITKA